MRKGSQCLLFLLLLDLRWNWLTAGSLTRPWTCSCQASVSSLHEQSDRTPRVHPFLPARSLISQWSWFKAPQAESCWKWYLMVVSFETRRSVRSVELRRVQEVFRWGGWSVWSAVELRSSYWSHRTDGLPAGQDSCGVVRTASTGLVRTELSAKGFHLFYVLVM